MQNEIRSAIFQSGSGMDREEGVEVHGTDGRAPCGSTKSVGR